MDGGQRTHDLHPPKGLIRLKGGVVEEVSALTLGHAWARFLVRGKQHISRHRSHVSRPATREPGLEVDNEGEVGVRRQARIHILTLRLFESRDLIRRGPRFRSDWATGRSRCSSSPCGHCCQGLPSSPVARAGGAVVCAPAADPCLEDPVLSLAIPHSSQLRSLENRLLTSGSCVCCRRGYVRGSDSCLNCNTADGPKHPERRITPKHYLQCIPNPCQCPHICV